MKPDICFYADEGNSIGPLSFDELSAFLGKQIEPLQVMVWSEQMTEWKVVNEVPELRRLFIKPPPFDDAQFQLGQPRP